MKSLIRPAIASFLALTVITGLAYPALITVIAKVVFPHQAGGSLIVRNGQPVGSELIGQNFADPKYFWSRLSATSPMPYNAQSSSGSTFGPTNPALKDAVKQRLDALKAADPSNKSMPPVDLVTASGSGLDPHISVAAAQFQMGRVAAVRHLSNDDLERVVRENTEPRTLGLLGEERVNVLKLNLALDGMKQ